VIQTENLTKVFRTDEVETLAIDNVNLRVERGEFVAIMGPSGCGKSTLLNLLGLLDVPTSGAYRFLNEDVSRLPERHRSVVRRKNIGFVFQNFNLIDELTVFENIELPLTYLPTTAGERRHRVDELLEHLQLVPRKNHYPRQLSGGQQQRVAVARAVVAEPELVLADEPTGNLDSSHGDDVMQSLVALNEIGTTIVMVTHAEMYASYAGRVVNLFDGRVVTEQVGRATHV
jgi:putative ABC transport system ATP-binding protein